MEPALRIPVAGLQDPSEPALVTTPSERLGTFYSDSGLYPVGRSGIPSTAGLIAFMAYSFDHSVPCRSRRSPASRSGLTHHSTGNDHDLDGFPVRVGT